MTRREWLAFLCGAAQAQGRLHHRDYRIDAGITVLGLTIFSRANVGKGFASAREGGENVTLRFGAGSIPARARGLNRLGFFEEVATEHQGDFAGGSYFGFMTSSPEKGLDEAKKALETNNGRIPYAAAQGRVTNGGATSVLARFPLPGSLTWENWETIVQQVQAGFADAKAESRNLDTRGDKRPPVSFLYAILRGIRMRAPKFSALAVYNGRLYTVEMTKDRDDRTARRLAEKKLTASPGMVRRVNGTVRRLPDGNSNPFRLWIEQDTANPVPLRIEYQARSFLRLVFEVEPPYTADSLKK